jgi:heptosyltransferase-2
LNPGAILVVGPAWVGDLVMAEPLLRLLAAREGAPPVDLLIPPHLASLAARMPGLRQVHELPAAHGELALGLRRHIGHALRDRGYAQAIVLPNSFKSALVPWFARIPLRTGWRGEMRYGLLNDRRHPRAMPSLQVERFTALAVPARAIRDRHAQGALPQPRLLAVSADALRQRLGIDGERSVLALCPGADYGPAKRWPAAHFAAVAAARIAAGWQVWLMGSADDAAVTREIRDRLEAPAREHCHDLAGRTTLGEAVDLLACAAVVLSNDTGLMHVAAALDRPLLAIFGSSSPRFTPPLSGRARVLASSIDCAPCYARSCRFGHYRCLAEQGPEAVAGVLCEMERSTS